ncbi:hypothetical protein RFI_10133 [Reticulomyxa filosa]|uniref:Transmembrane protein n=1 Tax=Reticulomyxa filosa TaxID=46433 RepID=X6NMT6_RETFI|nr:hypothetical protein RFI_10133 [Reticulomyxa filosa]|eukprot:ETO26999.1 hypothetical protein RFI_10133 [Reticulomyxa filosa]
MLNLVNENNNVKTNYCNVEKIELTATRIRFVHFMFEIQKIIKQQTLISNVKKLNEKVDSKNNEIEQLKTEIKLKDNEINMIQQEQSTYSNEVEEHIKLLKENDRLKKIVLLQQINQLQKLSVKNWVLDKLRTVCCWLFERGTMFSICKDNIFFETCTILFRFCILQLIIYIAFLYEVISVFQYNLLGIAVSALFLVYCFFF